MRITKRQLRRIIKEAKDKVPAEQLGAVHERHPGPAAVPGAMDQLHTAIDALIGELGSEGAQMELQGIVDEWETETHRDGQYNEGTSLEQMPDAWRQVLKDCLKGR